LIRFHGATHEDYEFPREMVLIGCDYRSDCVKSGGWGGTGAAGRAFRHRSVDNSNALWHTPRSRRPADKGCRGGDTRSIPSTSLRL